jgi:hypothetical protein
LLALRLKLNPNPLPRMNSRDMGRYCTPLTEVLWDLARSESTFDDASKAVNTVAKGNLDSDSLRTQSFTENLKAFCSPK